MTVIAVTGASGGHGVSTLTAALALVWPAPCLLMECDPSGGDIAGWWDLPASPGLASAVAATPDTADGVLVHATRVRSSVAVLAAPVRSAEASVTVAASVHRILPLLVSAGAIEVLVDAGRSTAQLAGGAQAASVTVVVARQVPGAARATAALLERTADLLDACRRSSMPTLVAAIGQDPFPLGEVARFLGQPVHSVADDLLGAAVLAGRPGRGRMATRSRLLRSVRPLAEALYTQVAELSGATS